MEAGTIPIKVEFVERTQSDSPSRHDFIIAFPSDVPALTAAVARGDEDASREFFNRYGDRVFRYLIVVTRGREDDAREILSTILLKAIRCIRLMPTEDDLWRWLSRIAWTTFIDHCRRSNRQIPTAEVPENLAASTVDRSLNATLDECLLELPLEERDIVERYYFEDESQDALAESTHSTRKAVESRLARIRQKLRAAILKKLS